MQIKTPEGIGESQPLTDIQEYNKQLKRNNNLVRSLLIFGIIVFVSIILFIIYLDVTNFTYWIIRTWKTIGCPS